MPKFLRRAGASSFKLLALVSLSLTALVVLASPPQKHVESNASSRAPASLQNVVPLVDRLRDGASDMVSTAMNFIGVRYRFGGESAERGFDCSGFTRQVFEASIGLLLPRRAEQQARAPGLTPVARDELQPGDLVFFNTLRRTFSHVGIYVGDGKFIHSPSQGGEVRVDDMRFVYWAKRFTGARRAETMAEQVETDRESAAFQVPSFDAVSLQATPLEAGSLKALLSPGPMSVGF